MKNAPGSLFKSTTENIPFFSRNEIFIVRKVLPIDNNHSSYNYWISKSDEDKIIDKRFLRQELFALKNQFETKKKWSQFLSIVIKLNFKMMITKFSK